MNVLRAVTLGAGLLTCGQGLAGEPEARVRLTLPRCELPKLPPEQLSAAIALELGSSGLMLVPAEGADTGEIEVSLNTTCADDEPLELRAAWGSRTGSRELALTELPTASRPRAVALVVAELLAALRPEDKTAPIDVELEEESPPPAAPKRAPAAAARHAATPELAASDTEVERDADTSGATRSHQAVTFKGEVRSFSLQPIVVGFRAGYEFSHFSLGFAFLHGSVVGNYGTLSTTIAYGYSEWRIHEFGGRERPWFSFGPRLGVGLVMLTPTASAASIAAGMTDPFLDIAQFCQLWATVGPLRFGTQLEIGYAVGSIAYETGSRLASYAGPFGSALLEAAWLL